MPRYACPHRTASSLISPSRARWNLAHLVPASLLALWCDHHFQHLLFGLGRYDSFLDPIHFLLPPIALNRAVRYNYKVVFFLAVSPKRGNNPFSNIRPKGHPRNGKFYLQLWDVFSWPGPNSIFTVTICYQRMVFSIKKCLVFHSWITVLPCSLALSQIGCSSNNDNALLFNKDLYGFYFFARIGF